MKQKKMFKIWVVIIALIIVVGGSIKFIEKSNRNETESFSNNNLEITKENVGKNTTVQCTVKTKYIDSEGNTFLSVVTSINNKEIVIPISNNLDFNSSDILKNTQLEVTGKISEYKGELQIIPQNKVNISILSNNQNKEKLDSTTYMKEENEQQVENLTNFTENNSKIDNSYSYYNENIDTSSEYYSVYTEAFVNKSYADKSVEQLKNKNIDSIIIEEDGFYKIRVGVSTNLSNARQIASEMEAKGCKTYILGYSDYFEDKLIELANLYENGEYDDFKREYNYVMNKLENQPIFGRYKQLLKKKYNE